MVWLSTANRFDLRVFGHFGCTGTDEFHEILNTEFEPVESVTIPRYMGIRDQLLVYERHE